MGASELLRRNPIWIVRLDDTIVWPNTLTPGQIIDVPSRAFQVLSLNHVDPDETLDPWINVC